MHVYTENTADGARRIGLATLAALLLAIAGVWHGLSFLGQDVHGASGATVIWLLADLGGGILSCVLVVVYLRHMSRTADTLLARRTWMLAILVLGPFVMPLYWWAYMRQVPYSSPQALHGHKITPEEARLLATVSVAPPSAADAP